MALRPVAQPGLCVDMACIVQIPKFGSPRTSHLLRSFERAIGVVLTPHQQTGKRQLRHRYRRPAGQNESQHVALGIARSHKQSCLHPVRVLRMRCPGGGEDATQAVRHQHHGFTGIEHHLFQPCHPVTAPGLHPVVLINTPVTVQGFPVALPMLRRAVLPARKNENAGRFHVKQSPVTWF